MSAKTKEIVNKGLVEKYGNLFSRIIRDRGEDYYEDGKILNCIKSDGVYYATVNGDHNYNITIEEKNNELVMDCTCPYEYFCKHEYATLLAIDDGDYTNVKLMPHVIKKKISTHKLLELIPAEEIKEYIINDKNKNVIRIDENRLEKDFIKYAPKQEYEYYYNNLYNICSTDLVENDCIKDYLFDVKNYISFEDYYSAFLIIKSIIEVYHDLDLIKIIDDFPIIGMFLRVCYRKSCKETKSLIQKYLNQLTSNKFYNDLYLEDIVLSVTK